MFTADSGIQPLHTAPNPKLTFTDRIVQHTQSEDARCDVMGKSNFR